MHLHLTFDGVKYAKQMETTQHRRVSINKNAHAGAEITCKL